MGDKTGLYIEAEPLTRDQYLMLNNLIDSSSFKGSEVEHVIKLKLALTEKINNFAVEER